MPVLESFPLDAQTTAITYQGRLGDNGAPADGVYDLRFAVYDAATNGNVIGGPLTNFGVAAINGLFTVTLDFGEGVFDGADRWLELGVRTNGGGSFTTLMPRQSVTAAPYAILAGSVSGVIPGGGLSGVYSSMISLNNPANSFHGSGAGLTGLNAVQLTTGAVPSAALSNAWKISGNANTTAGTHFVGTTDNQPLEIKVSNLRAVRYEYGSGNTPNVVGGAFNQVAPGIQGAFIGGGGMFSAEDKHTNRVNASFGAVVGGFGNMVGEETGFIGGGANNHIWAGAFASTITGGRLHQIESHSSGSFIGGGDSHVVRSNAFHAVVSGGYANQIRQAATNAVIAGGYQNEIGTNASLAAIGGGGGNINGAVGGTIAGGGPNEIRSGANHATISGGEDNVILPDARRSAVGGGSANVIESEAESAVIAGGSLNRVLSYAASIGGGAENSAEGEFGVIGGGSENTLSANRTTIAGGANNQVTGVSGTVGGGSHNIASGDYATVAGGANNEARGFASTVAGGGIIDGESAGNSAFGDGSTVSGGVGNHADGDFAVVIGGESNSAQAQYAVAAGGMGNHALAELSFVAGRSARALHPGAVVWADDTHDMLFLPSTATNQFTSRASGGVRFFTDGAATTGVELAPGSGAWASLSDRNAKENFSPANSREILEKVVALPLATWNYKAQNKAIRHIGPMAQDFHAAFGVGEDERRITTVDADGVALAAIQGLNQKLEGQRVENLELRRELEELKQLVNSLTQKLNGGAR